jgi:xylan 1,4-beta-xylosidase
MPQVRNPILPGFNADPSVLRVGDDGELCLTGVLWFVLMLSSAYTIFYEVV